MSEHGWTLIAVALGWLLAELGQYLRLRRDDRRAFGRALAHALEIQGQIYFLLGLTLDEAYARLSDQDRRLLNAGFRSAIDGIAAARTKFEDTVELVAGVDPLLGARLRRMGTSSVGDAVAVAGSSDASAEVLRQLQPALAWALERVSELVSQLAWRHGIATWIHLKVRRSSGDESLAAFLPGATSGEPRRGPTRS